MNDKIKHSGIVEEVGRDVMKVRILQTSACAGCKVAGHCNAAESKEKIIDVRGHDMLGTYSKGDKVVVAVSQQMGMKAVGLAFVVPFAILIIAIFIAEMSTGDEAIAALVGILSLVPYYGLLYAFRDKLERKFTFTVET